MLLEILKESKEENKLLSIYTNKFETNKFSVGYILDVDKNCYITAQISPTGTYDGYGLALISNIYRIEQDGKYEQKIKQLYDYKEQSHNIFDITDENLLNKFLSFAEKENLIVTIELCDSDLDDVQGYIKEISSTNIIINCIDEYGYDDGTSIVDLQTITSIICDSEDEAMLKILSQINKK